MVPAPNITKRYKEDLAFTFMVDSPCQAPSKKALEGQFFPKALPNGSPKQPIHT